MTGLSESERAELRAAEDAWVVWRERGPWESYIVPTVEAIAARHAAAAVEAALAPIVALRDEWDDEARQAWVVADSIGSGDIIADQRSRRAERLRAALDLGATR